MAMDKDCVIEPIPRRPATIVPTRRLAIHPVNHVPVVTIRTDEFKPVEVRRHKLKAREASLNPLRKLPSKAIAKKGMKDLDKYWED